MVDPTLHEITVRIALRVRGMMNWLIRTTEPNETDALMYANLVRAAVLGAADEGEYRQLGVTDGEAIRELHVNAHLHVETCKCLGRKPGDILLDFDWSATPLVRFTNLPDPEDN